MAFRERKPRSREPKSLGELIQGLSADAGWSERLALGRLIERWPEVAGPAIGAASRPVRLDAGVLVIATESNTWASELRLLGASLKARVERVLGPGSVSEIRVVARGAPGDRSTRLP